MNVSTLYVNVGILWTSTAALKSKNDYERSSFCLSPDRNNRMCPDCTHHPKPSIQKCTRSSRAPHSGPTLVCAGSPRFLRNSIGPAKCPSHFVESYTQRPTRFNFTDLNCHKALVFFWAVTRNQAETASPSWPSPSLTFHKLLCLEGRGDGREPSLQWKT
jgi:hypothetical protein